MKPENFKAPFIEQQEIWRQADGFRNRVWPSNEIPIGVLEIVEFELDLEIRPISRLKEDNDIDALLLGNWKTIVVDQGQSRKFEVSSSVIERRLTKEKLWPLA